MFWLIYTHTQFVFLLDHFVVPSIILDIFHSHNADKSENEMKSMNTTDGNGKICINNYTYSITYYSHPKLERVDSKNCDVPMPPQMP